MRRKVLFSEPLPFGTISIESCSAASEKAMFTTGTRMPQEVCSFLRVIGCTTDERSGCSTVARAQPRAMAASRSTPSTWTLRPMVTL